MPDDAASVLRQALETASQLRRENAQLRQTASERTTQLFGEAGARISAQDAAIDGGIASAEQEHAANQQLWERLQSEGDFKGAGEAMAKMIDASTRMASLRSQKDQIAVQRANLERQMPQGGGDQQQQQQIDPLEGMNERERQWISEHPEFLSNPHYAQRVRGAAAYAAQTLGLSRDSKEYTDEIDRLLNQGSSPVMSIGGDTNDNNSGADPGNGDVTVPRMPTPEPPRPVSVDPNDTLSNEMQMVDQMYPQTRAVGQRGGAGISSVAAPPTRRIREMSDQIRRGRAIEPTLEELETARIIIPQVLGAEGAAMSDEDKVRTYFTWYNSPSSQRKLRRWYGRDAA